MEWEADAAKAMERVPFFVRRMAKRKVEELVSSQGRRTVTLADVRRARDEQMAATSPHSAESSVATAATVAAPPNDTGPTEEESGLSEAQIRHIEHLADSLAGHETRFYSIRGCGGAVGCPLALADVRSITDAVVATVDSSGLAQTQASRIRGPVLSHHKFKAAVAGCPNCCSEPQIKDFALVARSRPGLGAGDCVECGACGAACKEEAVQVLDSAPSFDPDRCVGCGSCAEACPTGSIVVASRGYDVLVGGRLGRHPRLAATIAEAASLAEALAILGRCLDLLVDEGRPGERLGSLLERVGLEKLRA